MKYDFYLNVPDGATRRFRHFCRVPSGRPLPDEQRLHLSPRNPIRWQHSGARGPRPRTPAPALTKPRQPQPLAPPFASQAGWRTESPLPTMHRDRQPLKKRRGSFKMAELDQLPDESE